MKISADSQYALINRASENGPQAVRVQTCCFPRTVACGVRGKIHTQSAHNVVIAQEIQLLDLTTEQIVRKYSGHNQSKHVIRSCFGGVEGNFIVSGSEGTSPATCL